VIWIHGIAGSNPACSINLLRRIMMNLFQLEKITLHSGKKSKFKIECDYFTEAFGNWETLAYLGSRIIGKFSSVSGVPRGGIPFAKAMQKYVSDEGPHLIVDDVLTTGGSIEKEIDSILLPEGCIGLVAFARGECPGGIKCIFSMNKDAEDAEYMGE